MRYHKCLLAVGVLCGVIGVGSGSSWAHDPTDKPAWKALGAAGAVPNVRALAAEGTTVFALCDKGLVAFDAQGRERVLAPPQAVADVHSVAVSPSAIWLGGSDGVRWLRAGVQYHKLSGCQRGMGWNLS